MNPTDFPTGPGADIPSASGLDGQVRPFWIAEDLDSFPEDLQAAITGIVVPAYRELVLAAKPGLQQSVGLTIVHQMWIEVLYAHELGTDTWNAAESAESERRLEMIERLLRLTGAKLKAHNFLLRLHEFRQKYGSLSV